MFLESTRKGFEMDMKLVLLALAVVSSYAQVRFTTLTGTQTGAPLPIVAKVDPCAEGFLLQHLNSAVAPATLPRACRRRTTNSQNTFYAPSRGTAAAIIGTGLGSQMTLNFGGVGLPGPFAGLSIDVALAQRGQSCATAVPAVGSIVNALVGGTLNPQILIDGTANSWNGNGIGSTGLNDIDMDLEEEPRDICFRIANTQTNPNGVPASGLWFYSGFRFKVTRYCLTTTECTAAYTLPATGVASAAPLNQLQAQLYTSRSACCGNVCHNSNTHSCCSAQTSRVIEKATEKCCDAAMALSAFIGEPCECYARLGSSVAPTVPTGVPVCPTEESECCLPSKYTELLPTDCGVAGGVCGLVRGQCYNPRTHRCCSDGNRYDPGSQQCCVVNGLQSFDFPCPCSQDSHCQGENKANFAGSIGAYIYAADGQTRQKCCIRTTPAAPTQTGCSRYANYPSGYSLPLTNQLQQCTGTCIDTRYQICCNGVACRREFERCCNATCCNRFSGTCTTGRKQASPGRAANNRDFQSPQDFCSTIEKLDEVRSFWIFILPTALLLATLGSLGFALVFANKAANRLFSFIEKLIIGISVVVILLGSVLYFSPAYKYGIFIVIVGVLSILTAAARVKWFNAFTTIAIVVLLFYIINPFDGNNYLTFNYLRLANGEADSKSHGLFHLLTRMYPRFASEGGMNNLCVQWYQGYFRYDPARYSTLESNLANPTFAYCSRGFLTGLLIVSSINLVLLVALFILSIFGLVLRFRKQYTAEAPVELAPFPLY